jgi:DNA-binding MarR family transcriptional regulator
MATTVADTEHATGSIALMLRAMRLVARRETEVVTGMRLKHLVTLTHLRDLGEDGASQQALGERLFMDANNLVLLLNELERESLIERRRDASDRRRHIVVITSAGLRALKRAEAKLETIEDDVLAPLDTAERATLRMLLHKIVLGHCLPACEPATGERPA